ncbi:MAG: hypothetical protein WEE50_04720 [Chloroflexota bacterium]
MTEILTESFCERCGTRYTFESARPKTRLKGVKVLSRGLKNFVLSDDTSIDEAMAAARSETDRETTAHQIDAFHKTFNFCMSCRQYTCPNCWNEPEARCLSCAPLELPEPPVRLEDLATIGEGTLIGEPSPGNGAAAHEHDVWPEPIGAIADAELEPEAAMAPPPAEEVAGPSIAADAATAPGPVEVTPEPAAADVEETPEVGADPARKAAAQTTGLLRRFRPGQSLDAHLDAYERERSDAARSRTTDAEAPDAVEPTSVEPPVEGVVAAEATEPAAEPEPESLAAATGADVVEQPTWSITAPDPGAATAAPPTSEPGGPIPLQAGAAHTEAPTADPQWPARAQWPGAAPAAGLPFLGRPAAGQGGIEALWAASNEELVTAAPVPGRTATSSIQPCVSCGLSLSATARFCRRCGTLQNR